MYLPAHFDESRTDVLHAAIAANPFATLVTLGASGLEANHLPFELDAAEGPHGTLRAHVARSNPVWRELVPGAESLVIFQGPHAYVSPSWYATKAETGKVVPTWNYVVVHARGTLRAIEDRDWLRGLLERLTSRREAARPQPWSMADAPADYIERMLGAIVGLELPIARVQGKWKLSQNRVEPDRAGVIAGLRGSVEPQAVAVAEMMAADAPGGG